MSLLEDVFLEDEAGEAQDLERIIEGDEYDERPRALSPDSDNNSEKEDEAEEDKRRVDPTSAKPKRVVKNPRVVLNPARLMGPRGIQVIPDHFKEFKFKGKGREMEDLDLVLKKLEHWAYRLFPKFQFEDCLKKIETLGKKRPVVVHLTKIRSDQYISEETVVQRDSSDDETPQPAPEEDEFDKLLQQQIDIARATPAPTSHKKQGFATPMVDRLNMPKATSSPSINEEQRERMIKNRQMAEERRLARLKQNNTDNVQDISTPQPKTNDNTLITVEDENISLIKNHRSNVIDSSDEEEHSVNKIIDLSEHERDIDVTNVNKETIQRVKSNRSNVIDSSDSDDDQVLVVNESITADIHSNLRDDCEDDVESDGRNRNTANEEEITTGHPDIEMNEIVDEPTNVSPQKDIEGANIETEEKHIESDGNIEASSSQIAKSSLQKDIEKVTSKEMSEENNIETDLSKHSCENTVTESEAQLDSEELNKDSEKYKKDDQELHEQETEINEKKNDYKENEFEEIMDVDFSDDF